MIVDAGPQAAARFLEFLRRKHRERENTGSVRGRAVGHPDPPGVGPDHEAAPGRHPHARRLARRQPDPPGEPRGALAGLRDRTLLSVMLHSFARVTAVLGMRRQDYLRAGEAGLVEAPREGGKRHDVPAHHRAAAALDAYVEAGGLVEPKAALFQTVDPAGRRLTGRALDRRLVLAMIRSDQLGRDPIGVLQRRGVLARVGFEQVPPVVAKPVGTPGFRVPRASELARFRAVVRLARRLAAKSRVLVFAPSVDYAGVLAAALRCEGTRATAVSSRDDSRLRRSRLRAFERGELSVIVNKQLLATGYDCPAVRHVILATRIGSAILFEQIVGRASRGPRVGGHARSTVWQFEDHLTLHGLPQSYHRYRDYDWDSQGSFR